MHHRRILRARIANWLAPSNENSNGCEKEAFQMLEANQERIFSLPNGKAAATVAAGGGCQQSQVLPRQPLHPHFRIALTDSENKTAKTPSPSSSPAAAAASVVQSPVHSPLRPPPPQPPFLPPLAPDGACAIHGKLRRLHSSKTAQSPPSPRMTSACAAAAAVTSATHCYSPRRRRQSRSSASNASSSWSQQGDCKLLSSSPPPPPSSTSCSHHWRRRSTAGTRHLPYPSASAVMAPHVHRCPCGASFPSLSLVSLPHPTALVAPAPVVPPSQPPRPFGSDPNIMEQQQLLLSPPQPPRPFGSDPNIMEQQQLLLSPPHNVSTHAYRCLIRLHTGCVKRAF